MSRCGIIILAAGASTRMESPKQLLEFEGATLLRRAVNTALASVCRPVVVVLGSGAGALQTTLAGDDVAIVMNEGWSGGMGTSIRAGINAIIEEAIDAAMVFLCDQPMITASSLNAMVGAHFAHGKKITAAHYGGSHGTPVIFSRSLFTDLSDLEDHEGGKVILQRYPGEIQSVDLPEGENDVDTKADFVRLLGSAKGFGNCSTG